MNEPEPIPESHGNGPLARVIDPNEIAMYLSGLLGLAPAHLRHAQGQETEIEVDARALMTWVLIGVEAMRMPAPDQEPARCGPWMPAARVVSDAARRVALILAMERHVSITSAAEAMSTSRRALRDSLKRLGLYEAFRNRYQPRRKVKPLTAVES